MKREIIEQYFPGTLLISFSGANLNCTVTLFEDEDIYKPVIAVSRGLTVWRVIGPTSWSHQNRKRSGLKNINSYNPPINFGARSLVETYHVVKIRTETWYHSSAFISTTTKQINKPKFGSNSLVFQGRKRKTFCRSQWPRNHPQPRHDHQWLFFFLSTTKVRLEK